MSARTLVTPSAPQLYRFTVEKFHAAAEAGVFPQDARLELVEGEIFMMPPIGPDHSAHTRSLLQFLVRSVPKGVDVSVAEPVVLSKDTELVPDFSLVKHRADFYKKSHPQPKDVLLIIEIAKSSLEFDMGTKSELYARAGIAEYWVLNVASRCLHVFTGARKQGYHTRRDFQPHEPVTCGTIPQLKAAVSEMLL